MSCGLDSGRSPACRRRRWPRSSHIPSATTIATSRNLTIDLNQHAKRSVARCLPPPPCGQVHGRAPTPDPRPAPPENVTSDCSLDGCREVGEFAPACIASTTKSALRSRDRSGIRATLTVAHAPCGHYSARLSPHRHGTARNCWKFRNRELRTGFPEGSGRNPELVVGVRGFEPPTPASRTQYSTRLSYTPNGIDRRYSVHPVHKQQGHVARALFRSMRPRHRERRQL